MSSVNGILSSDFWKCSICHEIMDGKDETNGEVCVSNRCMHVFHRFCIENAIRIKRNCPLCRSLLGVSQISPNPEYSNECRAWLQNPNEYTFKSAFVKKHSCEAEEIGLKPEDVLRPRTLQGKPWNPETTPDDNYEFFLECINNGYSQEEICSISRRVIVDLRLLNIHNQSIWDDVNQVNTNTFNFCAETHRECEKIQLLCFELMNKIDENNRKIFANLRNESEKLNRYNFTKTVGFLVLIFFISLCFRNKIYINCKS